MKSRRLVNAVLHPKMDRRDPNKPYHKPRTSKLLTDFSPENVMVGHWRATHPQIKEFSWENTRGAAFRIDYALLPGHLYHQVAKTEYQTAPVHTDHRIFEVYINLIKFKQAEAIQRSKTLYNQNQTLSLKSTI